MQTSNCETYRPSGDRVWLKDIHVPNADKGERQKADYVYHVIYGISVDRQLIHVLFLPCWDWSVNCWSWIFGTILKTSIYIAKICHRTRLASQSCCTCHVHEAGCSVWQHVDNPSDKLKKIKSCCSCTLPLKELFGWAHTEIFTRLGQTTSLKKTYTVHWFGSEKMERDYIGHIYQIRYGVLKHMLEKLLDGIFHWASSIKVIFMETCRWRSSVWKWIAR